MMFEVSAAYQEYGQWALGPGRAEYSSAGKHLAPVRVNSAGWA